MVRLETIVLTSKLGIDRAAPWVDRWTAVQSLDPHRSSVSMDANDLRQWVNDGGELPSLRKRLIDATKVGTRNTPQDGRVPAALR